MLGEEIVIADGYEWEKIMLQDGTEGYVARKYLQLKKDNTVIKVVDTSSARNAELKLRKEPGLDSEIIFKLQNGSEVYIKESEFNKSTDEKIDGYEWVKIILQDGTEGYVAKKYLADSKQDKFVRSGEIEVKNLTLLDGKNLDGSFGIDVSPSVVSSGKLEDILKGKVKIDTGSKYGDIEAKPEFVYIKLGATRYGDKFALASASETTKNKTKALIRLCEKYGMPWGGYYYSQAINEEETQKEIDFITSMYNDLGELKYHVLPFAIDIEEHGRGTNPTRLMKYSSKNYEQKLKITQLKDDMASRLRKK